MNIDYEEVKKVGIYDYVAEHYWEMTKDQLKSFCLAGMGATMDYVDSSDYDDIEEDAIVELTENDV